MTTLSRRSFTKSLAIGAGALAIGGNKPARAQSYEDMTMNQAANFLKDFADYFYFPDPSAMNWRTFGNASLAVFSILRSQGLDQQLNDLYGIDEFASGCVGQAYDEGGWNQFWALTLLPITGLQAEFTPNFDNTRTGQSSNIWISGSGPLSAGLVDAGFAEFAPWPESFPQGPFPSATSPSAFRERVELDDFTKQTIGPPPPPIPWYSPYDSWMPTIPLNSTVIWLPIGVADKCKALNRLFLVAKGLAVAGIAGGFAAKIAIGSMLYVINVMTDIACGKV